MFIIKFKYYSKRALTILVLYGWLSTRSFAQTGEDEGCLQPAEEVTTILNKPFNLNDLTDCNVYEIAVIQNFEDGPDELVVKFNQEGLYKVDWGTYSETFASISSNTPVRELRTEYDYLPNTDPFVQQGITAYAKVTNLETGQYCINGNINFQERIDVQSINILQPGCVEFVGGEGAQYDNVEPTIIEVEFNDVLDFPIIDIDFDKVFVDPKRFIYQQNTGATSFCFETKYFTPGTYLTYLGFQGLGERFTNTYFEVTIEECNTCPDPQFELSSSQLGLPTTFNTELGVEDEWDITWDFGDGTSPVSSGFGLKNKHTISHIYTNTGSYTAKVIVTNEYGDCIKSEQFNINVTQRTPTNCADCIPAFALIPGEKYVISAWTKVDRLSGITSYNDPYIQLDFGSGQTTDKFRTKGVIIDGWQRIEEEFEVPLNMTGTFFNLGNDNPTNDVFYDDIRVHPLNAGMRSFVYDPQSLRLMAVLDENNYATLYEYNDEGLLVRVKKETERGVETIQESRTSMPKK